MRRRRTAEQREAICRARGWLCHLCAAPIDPVRDRWELDHVIALAAGGTDDDDNIAPAHARCHLAKTVEDVERIAKGRRIRALYLGTRPPPRRPMPGSRRSKWKRKFDGTTVPR